MSNKPNKDLDGLRLGQLFAEADKIGNQYFTNEENAARAKELKDATDELNKEIEKWVNT